MKRAAHTATHAGYTVSNPVTVAVGYQKLQETGDSQSKLIANLVANVQALKQEIDEMKVMREQASLFSVDRVPGGANTGGPLSSAERKAVVEKVAMDTLVQSFNIGLSKTIGEIAREIEAKRGSEKKKK